MCTRSDNIRHFFIMIASHFFNLPLCYVIYGLFDVLYFNSNSGFGQMTCLDNQENLDLDLKLIKFQVIQIQSMNLRI